MKRKLIITMVGVSLCTGIIPSNIVLATTESKVPLVPISSVEVESIKDEVTDKDIDKEAVVDKVDESQVNEAEKEEETQEKPDESVESADYLKMSFVDKDGKVLAEAETYQDYIDDAEKDGDPIVSLAPKDVDGMMVSHVFINGTKYNVQGKILVSFVDVEEPLDIKWVYTTDPYTENDGANAHPSDMNLITYGVHKSVLKSTNLGESKSFNLGVRTLFGGFEVILDAEKLEAIQFAADDVATIAITANYDNIGLINMIASKYSVFDSIRVSSLGGTSLTDYKGVNYGINSSAVDYNGNINLYEVNIEDYSVKKVGHDIGKISPESKYVTYSMNPTDVFGSIFIFSDDEIPEGVNLKELIESEIVNPEEEKPDGDKPGDGNTEKPETPKPETPKPETPESGKEESIQKGLGTFSLSHKDYKEMIKDLTGDKGVLDGNYFAVTGQDDVDIDLRVPYNNLSKFFEGKEDAFEMKWTLSKNYSDAVKKFTTNNKSVVEAVRVQHNSDLKVEKADMMSFKVPKGLKTPNVYVVNGAGKVEKAAYSISKSDKDTVDDKITINIVNPSNDYTVIVSKEAIAVTPEGNLPDTGGMNAITTLAAVGITAVGVYVLATRRKEDSVEEDSEEDEDKNTEE